jgi:hypothetical protein
MELYSIQHYATQFISDLRQVCGFLRILPASSTYKTEHHHTAEILLKVALGTITLTPDCMMGKIEQKKYLKIVMFQLKV